MDAARARVEELTTCLCAVTDLMNPSLDLQFDDRDRQAILLGFLTRELMAAQKRVFQQSGGGAQVVSLRP